MSEVIQCPDCGKCYCEGESHTCCEHKHWTDNTSRVEMCDDCCMSREDVLEHHLRKIRDCESHWQRETLIAEIDDLLPDNGPTEKEK